MAARFAFYASVAEALVALPRTGPSPIKGTRDIEHIPLLGLEDLPDLHEDLEKYIREAPDAPKCPLTPNGLVSLFGFMRRRHKCKLARSRTPAARGASFVFGAKSFSINLGKPKFDGELLEKMKAQKAAWDKRPPPRFSSFPSKFLSQRWKPTWPRCSQEPGLSLISTTLVKLTLLSPTPS